jgi:hypothetical protein
MFSFKRIFKALSTAILILAQSHGSGVGWVRRALLKSFEYPPGLPRAVTHHAGVAAPSGRLSLVPKLRLGILKPEAPASRLFLWRGRERTEPVWKQSFLCWVPQAELGKQQKQQPRRSGALAASGRPFFWLLLFRAFLARTLRARCTRPDLLLANLSLAEQRKVTRLRVRKPDSNKRRASDTSPNHRLADATEVHKLRLSLVPKLRLGILKPEAPASRLFLWRGRERTEPVWKQSFLCWVPQAELGKQQTSHLSPVGALGGQCPP